VGTKTMPTLHGNASNQEMFWVLLHSVGCAAQREAHLSRLTPSGCANALNDG